MQLQKLDEHNQHDQSPGKYDEILNKIIIYSSTARLREGKIFLPKQHCFLLSLEAMKSDKEKLPKLDLEGLLLWFQKH